MFFTVLIVNFVQPNVRISSHTLEDRNFFDRVIVSRFLFIFDRI